MKIKHLMVRAMLVAVCCCGSAQAAITCSITAVDNFISSYDGLLPADVLSMGTFTVTCTRTNSNDATSVSFKIRNDDGKYNQNANNRARLGTTSSYLKYDLFTNSTYTTNWRTSKSNDIDGTINFGTGVPSTLSLVSNFYPKIYQGQLGIPQGVYTDTVVLTLVYGVSGTTVNNAGVISVSISNIPTCSFSTPPGTVAFTYTAFSGAAATASTTFYALCSTNLPYTMALDSSSGVAAGLQYTLSLSSSAGTGSGGPQRYDINGSMPAGQAGTCATGTCTDTKPHSVTISY